MTGLGFNFIRRAFIVPITATVIAIAMISITVPKIAASTQVTEASVPEVDLSSLTLVDYDNFDDLEAGNYIGTISSDALGINAAVTYSLDSVKNTVLLDDISKEPWNNGCIVLYGANTGSQFKNLHHAQVGDEVIIDFYSNDDYTYKITDISYGNTEKDVPSFRQNNALIMCLPYNNFDDLGNSYYYAVYVAEKI